MRVLKNRLLCFPRPLILCSFCFLLTSCFFSSNESAPAASATEPTALTTLELLLARTSLHATDFEHYRLDDKILISECGQIKRGRFYPSEKNIETLSKEVLAELSALAEPVTLAPRSDLPKPGTLSAFYDPGQLTLSMTLLNSRPLSVETTVDALSPAKSPAAEAMSPLIERLRGVRAPLCGQKRFFGIDRQER